MARLDENARCVLLTRLQRGLLRGATRKMEEGAEEGVGRPGAGQRGVISGCFRELLAARVSACACQAAAKRPKAARARAARGGAAKARAGLSLLFLVCV
jgi:hypothetical protein